MKRIRVLLVTFVTVATLIMPVGPALAADDPPDVRGMTYSQALLALQSWDPDVTVYPEPYDTATGQITLTPGFALPADANTDQFTVALEQRPSRQRSELAVTSGAILVVGLTVQVPSLVGLTGAQAQALLTSSGFAVSEADSTFATDVVLAQAPIAGGVLGVAGFPVATVTLRMGAPPRITPPVMVPDVTGMSVGGAKGVLRIVGLSATLTPPNAPDSDTVRDQDPVAGSRVAAGSAVALDAVVPQLPSGTASGFRLPGGTAGLAAVGAAVLLLALLLVYLLARTLRRRRPARPDGPRRPDDPHRPDGSDQPDRPEDRPRHPPLVRVRVRATAPPHQEVSVSGPAFRIGMHLRPDPPVHDVQEVKT